MADEASPKPVEAAVSAANFSAVQATRLPLQRRSGGFTLTELLVSMGVLVLLVLLFTQLLNSAATVTILGHKQIDADSQARQLLDRMTIDFAQMVKRSDVDYYLKSSAIPPPAGVRNLLQPGNDTIAFYSTVPGYYPALPAPTPIYPPNSPVSLVAYRVNAQNKLERIGKGLIWNGVSTTDTPVVFLPLLISNTWPYATNQNPDPAYEVIGPDVFRFEYYYKLTVGFTTDTLPANGWRSVAAIVV